MVYDYDEEARVSVQEKQAGRKWDFLKEIKLVHVFLIAFFALMMFGYFDYFNKPTVMTNVTLTNGTVIQQSTKVADQTAKYIPFIVIGGLFILHLLGKQRQQKGILTRKEAEEILKAELNYRIENEKYSGLPSGELVVTQLGKLSRQRPLIWFIPYYIREKILGLDTEIEHWFVGKVDAERGLNYIGSYITEKQPTGKEGGPDWDPQYYQPNEPTE